MTDTPMIFVSYHKSPNIEAYSAQCGSKVAKDVLPKSFKLDEPRGLYLDASSGSLIVVDGGKKTSTVYVCTKGSSSSSYDAGVSLIDPSTADSINHPFAVASDGQGTWYVSNQDSNVVAWFKVNLSDKKPSAKKKDVAPYLLGLGLKGSFLDATFVASSVSPLPAVENTPPAVSSNDGGLGASILPEPSGSGASGGTSTVQYKVQNSVRDVALAGGYLLVVDEPGGVIRSYDPKDGCYKGASAVANVPGAILSSPTHLLVTSNAVYVSFANQIYSSPLPTSQSPTLMFSPVFRVDKGSLSGMAVDGSGNFYLANRTQQTITSYPPNFGPYRWSKPVKDQPEFLLYVEG
jgi:hypothetical protein